jgi:hypothetical protein
MQAPKPHAKPRLTRAQILARKKARAKAVDQAFVSRARRCPICAGRLPRRPWGRAAPHGAAPLFLFCSAACVEESYREWHLDDEHGVLVETLRGKIVRQHSVPPRELAKK